MLFPMSLFILKMPKAPSALPSRQRQGGQDFGNIVELNGNSLRLKNDITDDLVEQLTGTAGDEDITLTVTITATDSADGSELTQVFALTLDATGANDAPVIKDGESDTQILGPLSVGGSADLNLSTFVSDEENDALTWAITSDTTGAGLSLNATTGLLSGTVASGAVDGTIEIEVHDTENAATPLTLSVFVDIA